jgi:hypothetical protein
VYRFHQILKKRTLCGTCRTGLFKNWVAQIKKKRWLREASVETALQIRRLKGNDCHLAIIATKSEAKK